MIKGCTHIKKTITKSSSYASCALQLYEFHYIMYMWSRTTRAFYVFFAYL